MEVTDVSWSVKDSLRPLGNLLNNKDLTIE